MSTPGNFFDYKSSTREFTRRIVLQELFFDKPNEDHSLVRQASKKHISTKNNDLKNICNALNRVEPSRIEAVSNISREEKEALEELKNLSKSELEIKKADKTDVWVVMDKTEYRNQLILEQHLHTPTYETADEDINHQVYSDLTVLVEKYASCLTKSERKFILKEDWSNAYFYVLPKINKCEEVIRKLHSEQTEYVEMSMPKTLKGRPICGGPNAVTQGASKLLDKILSPLVPHLKSYIKDEWDFVRTFPKKVEGSYKLLSCDVVSLYPSIPIDLGLEALEYWIDRLACKIDRRFTKEFILKFAEFVLRNNYFDFEGKMYHQIIGTAMGSIFAPPYSQLTIGFLEETKLFPLLLPSKFDAETCAKIIDYFFRFMDDGTTLFPSDVDEEVFLELLNSMHPAIRYTIEKAKRVLVKGVLVQMLVFLSILIFLDENGNIWTDVYYKDTNTHDYLHYESHHPNHIKKNIPHSLAKRIIILTTKEESMRKNLADLRKWLQDCGYPSKIIEHGFYTASLQGPAPPKSEKVIPVISTYYSNYTNEHLSIVAKQLIGNSSNKRVKEAFQNVKFVQALKQPPNLLRTLSNSRFITDTQKQKVGVWKCADNKCEICRWYLQEGPTITMANGTIWEIRSSPNCHSLNVIYFLVCAFCKKESKIGKTDHLRNRTNNHKTGCRHGTQSDDFDDHVYICGKLYEDKTKEARKAKEPFFKLYIMLECSSYHRLLDLEKKFHNAGMDTISRPK